MITNKTSIHLATDGPLPSVSANESAGIRWVNIGETGRQIVIFYDDYADLEELLDAIEHAVADSQLVAV